MVNYEFSVRGKSSLDAVSRKVVINRSSDLINEQAHRYRKFRKASQSIDEIKAAWNKKTEELKKKGYEEKEIITIKKDTKKLEDLEWLKNQSG